MTSFDGDTLFDSGPHRFIIGGLTLRHTLQEAPGGFGAHLSSQGVEARPILQTGTLLANDADAIKAQIDAIEAKLDGQSHALVDDRGRTHANVVMLAFKPGPIEPAGVRLKLDYRIEYLQVIP